MNDAPSLRSCSGCGLVQMLPPVPPRMRACCARCGNTLVRSSRLARSASRTAAIAAAALILYPFAVTLPIMHIERFGHRSEASILEGVSQLLGGGYIFVGLVVLLCSVVLPLAKLIGLLVLASGEAALRRSHHRALMHRLVEWTGRWGMLDVLLVAILVAAVKLGDLATVRAGPGAVAFTLVVLLSLLATAAFDPHAVTQPRAMKTADERS